MDTKLDVNAADLIDVKRDLKRTNTVVRRHLPTKEEIETEKKAIEIERRRSLNMVDQSTQTGLL
jgi:hypothetical protein